jgi:CRP/FNR family transcriptional regulator, cyclic AMP receptor protein
MGTPGSGPGIPALAWDGELAAGLEGPRREQATRLSMVAAREIRTGPWFPERLSAPVLDGFGLLVLEGMAARTVDCDGRTAAELLGPGDLLAPWQCGRPHETIDVGVSWTVLSDLRVALLDRAFAQRMAPFPEVSVALAARGMQRARDLAVRLSIAQFSRVDDRLTLLLWHLAERWGRVQADGVLVRLPLTHEMLSQLIAVRRPSVTVGLGELRKRGAVVSVPGGWLLRGEPAAGVGMDSVRALAS